MDSTKFKAEKFTEKNDFNLWRIKMKTLLIQQGFSDAIKPKPTNMIDEQKSKWQEVQEKNTFNNCDVSY